MKILYFFFKMVNSPDPQYGKIVTIYADRHDSNEELVRKYMNCCINAHNNRVSLDQPIDVDISDIAEASHDNLNDAFDIYINCSHENSSDDYFIYNKQRIRFFDIIKNKKN